MERTNCKHICVNQETNDVFTVDQYSFVNFYPNYQPYSSDTLKFFDITNSVISLRNSNKICLTGFSKSLIKIGIFNLKQDYFERKPFFSISQKNPIDHIKFLDNDSKFISSSHSNLESTKLWDLEKKKIISEYDDENIIGIVKYDNKYFVLEYKFSSGINEKIQIIYNEDINKIIFKGYNIPKQSIIFNHYLVLLGEFEIIIYDLKTLMIEKIIKSEIYNFQGINCTKKNILITAIRNINFKTTDSKIIILNEELQEISKEYKQNCFLSKIDSIEFSFFIGSSGFKNYIIKSII